MENPKYLTKPISVSTFLDGDNPVFGESVITVTVIDEAAGPFIELESMNPHDKEGKIRADIEQLEVILSAARELMKHHESN